MSVAAVFKRYRQVARSATEKLTDIDRRARLREQGIRVFGALTPVLAATAWPAVVAFSLTTKQWGAVLIDALSPVPPSASAWHQLVLKPSIKEVLKATAASALKAATSASTSVGE